MELNYPKLLVDEFNARAANRKGTYSLRAFARDLSLSPGYLSLVLRGYRRLSLATAYRICEKLGWPQEKSRQFTLFVHLEQAKSGYERAQIQAEISKIATLDNSPESN
jgi:transcriptional regulator with XRE-family HTH domain